MSGTLEYGKLMHGAMRGLIRDVLTQVGREGLPGDHHFFISFTTAHSGAQLADWLFDRYPEEMTIVIQEWFDNLEVDEDGFAITLNFGNSPEPLYIPFDAIRTFVDPSVDFGLRFDAPEGEEDSAPEEEAPEEAPAEEAPKEGQVVSLDQFRK